MKTGLDHYLLTQKVYKFEKENQELKAEIQRLQASNEELKDIIKDYEKVPQRIEDMKIAEEYFVAAREKRLTPELEDKMTNAFAKYSDDSLLISLYPELSMTRDKK